MLRHHADPEGQRVGGSAHLERLAVEQDLPPIGAHQPVQRAHQRGLARTVLPEQGVHLPRLELERRAVQRTGGAEALVQIGQEDPGHAS